MTEHKHLTKVPAPPPGIYPGVSMEEYRRWECASNSRLQCLLRSPAHLRAYLDGIDKDTPTKKLGRAIHCAVLEPDVFPTRYFRKPEPDPDRHLTDKGERSENPASTKTYKLEVAALQGEYPDADGLAAKDFDCCTGIRDSALAHPYVSPFLRGAGRAELSVVADDPVTGVRMKVRLDWHTDFAGGSIIDLKSSLDGGLADFERTILRMGYHLQASLYPSVARLAGLPVRRFVVVPAEKEPPYAVAGYRVSDGITAYVSLEQEFSQLRALLELYRECTTTKRFPAYVEEIREIGIPDFGWAQIDRQTEEVRKQLESLRDRPVTSEEAA